ncbi:hypothetical protein AVEN_160625-1 [Araneus ventricosus]|uniref:Uncharacterized protein n=1 Tax=Araneus ventricosus TaxID=182803 RepID=A0A4Y2RUS8_ARAVE|nr:hypothetical protein AVEN_160625-1 [Araneus ventricosus]
MNFAKSVSGAGPCAVAPFAPPADRPCLPIWTPNVVLLKIAGQEILSENIKRLVIHFFTKHVANGVHSPLFQQSSNPCIQLNKKDQEAFAGLLADMNITFNQIITLPNILDVLHNDSCEIHLASFGFQDKAQPTSMIKALFEETISKEFQDYFSIATSFLHLHSWYLKSKIILFSDPSDQSHLHS